MILFLSYLLTGFAIATILVKAECLAEEEDKGTSLEAILFICAMLLFPLVGLYIVFTNIVNLIEQYLKWLRK